MLQSLGLLRAAVGSLGSTDLQTPEPEGPSAVGRAVHAILTKSTAIRALLRPRHTVSYIFPQLGIVHSLEFSGTSRAMPLEIQYLAMY